MAKKSKLRWNFKVWNSYQHRNSWITYYGYFIWTKANFNFWTNYAQNEHFVIEIRKFKYQFSIWHIRIRQYGNFHTKRTIFNFWTNYAQNEQFGIIIQKFKYHFWIQHNRIGYYGNFQENRTIFIFWTKYAQSEQLKIPFLDSAFSSLVVWKFSY